MSPVDGTLGTRALSRVVGQAKRFSTEVATGVKRSTDVLQQLALEGLRQEIDAMVPRQAAQPGAPRTITVMVPVRSAVTSRQFDGSRKGLRGGVGAGLSVMASSTGEGEAGESGLPSR